MENAPNKMDRDSCRRNLKIRLDQAGIPYDADEDISCLMVQEISYIFENGKNFLEILQKCTFPKDFERIRQNFYRDLSVKSFLELRNTVVRIRMDFVHIQNTILRTCYYSREMILERDDIQERVNLTVQLSFGLLRGPVNRFISSLFRSLVFKTLQCPECRESFQIGDSIRVVGLKIYHENCWSSQLLRLPSLFELTEWICQIHPDLRQVVIRKH